MKRAKFVLALVATLAVAGGTFAFKAAKFSGIEYFTTTTANTTPSGSVVGKVNTNGTAKVYYTTQAGVNAPAANYAQIDSDL